MRFYTSDGTARSGSDYNGTSRVVYFSSGQSYQDVSVGTRTDGITEGTEYFLGRLSQYRSGDRISGSYAYQYISNVNSGSTYSISASSTYVNEGSNAVFRIYRSGNTSGTGYVRFYTSSGTAGSSDYYATSRLVYFSSGQSYQYVSVGTRRDNIKEGNEYFLGRLSQYRSGDRISASYAYQYIRSDS